MFGLADRSSLQYHRVQHGLLLASGLSRPCSDRAGTLGEALAIVASVVAINSTRCNLRHAAEPSALRDGPRESCRDKVEKRLGVSFAIAQDVRRYKE